MMGQVDALKMVEHLRTRLVDLAVSENHMRDSKVSNAARKVWAGPGNDGGLVSELWVEGAFPAKQSVDSLRTLSDDGLFPSELCHHLDANDAFPADRQLYNHQSESLRKSASARASEKPAFVITAGTGLGKTEAFLLPMLSDLWTAPERRQDGGMRCLILYPMNALIADQVDRIYQWLRGQNRLSVFHFTSETPENTYRADRRGEPRWEPCRIRSREEARGRESHNGRRIVREPFGPVPDIVITNYSMLEYMLCRPQDSCFFGPDLRCIILDEAHLYSGTLAAEIMMLLRRVRERCEVSPCEVLHVATSATLGGNDQDLRAFGSSLFSTEEASTIVVHGRYGDHDLGPVESPPARLAAAAEIARYSNLDFQTLTNKTDLVEDSPETVGKLREITDLLTSATTVGRAQRNHPSNPARFLYTSMREAPFIRRIAEILAKERGSVLSLNDLAEKLFGNQPGNGERDATIALLRLSAAARLRSSDLPLIPHRLHFLFRAPEGLAVCLNPLCSGLQNRRIEGVGCLQPLGDRCRYCEHILLPVHRCDDCGEWAISAHGNQEIATLEPGYYAESAIYRTYYLLVNPKAPGLQKVVLDPRTGEIRGHGADGIPLWEAPRKLGDPQVQQCPTCNSSWTKTDGREQPEWRRTCRSLIGGDRFILSVTAETVLNDLPSYHGTSRNWKPAEGRRLLTFSDSRASAARLGPLLTQQHEMQVVRAAMARCVEKLTPAETSAYLTAEVERIERKLAQVGAGDLKQHLKTELADKRAKLQQSRVGTSFTDYSALVAHRDEMLQILDRNTAERHHAGNYGQSDWRKNGEKIQNHIEAMIANELGRPLKKRVSLESVGLLEVVYPGIEELVVPPIIEEKLPLEAQKLLTRVWPDFVVLLLDTVRQDGCTDWSQMHSGRKWLGANPLTGRWLTRSLGGWGASRFVGTTPQQLRRTFATNVLKAAGCSNMNLDTLSKQMLYGVFDQLFRLAVSGPQRLTWLRSNDHHQTGHDEDDKALQILLDRLSVRVPAYLYRCEATGTVWTRCALGWIPIRGCRGILQATTPEQIDQDTRWGRARREFKQSPIFSKGLWAEEHSAQLSPQENRRLQDLFKHGIRNILSSTTTMELGIDIGGLNGVLLGNVPPGPANHRQRAGRAGRRSDGSAIVVTHARDSEYDREVFRRFGEFLRRSLRKPTIFSDRNRIIARHLHAVLLSGFLRSKQPERTGAMHAFGRMGAFCGVDFPDRWKPNLDSKPAWLPRGNSVASQFGEFLGQLRTEPGEFRHRLSLLAEHTTLHLVNSDRWQDFVNSAAHVFAGAIRDWNNEIVQLREAWDEIPAQPKIDPGRERAKANSIRHMVRSLCQITVIEWLADRRFLPRYGFPINLQRLSVRKAVEGAHSEYSEPDERYRLERNSLLALREYVPGARVLVGSRVATSRGLRKHWTDSNLDEALGLQYFSLECPEGHVYVRQSPEEACPRCDALPYNKRQLVFPRFGYTTAGWDTMPLGTNFERSGEQSVCPIAFAEGNEGEVTDNFAGISGARIIYREEARLLVRNHGQHRCGFAICTRCGFAESEVEYGQGRMKLPKAFATHASVFSSDVLSFCWDKGGQTAPVLRNRVLAAWELTDMALLEWPGAHSHLRDGVHSLGRALMLAGTRLLELDERELGMELIPLQEGNLGIVIYDTSPGGAGHCRELIGLGEEWIKAACRILYVDKKHHSRCKKACLDCILDFSGQYAANLLDRRKALQLLDAASAYT